MSSVLACRLLAGKKDMTTNRDRAREKTTRSKVTAERVMTLTELAQALLDTEAALTAEKARSAKLREALSWIERETYPEDGIGYERIHARASTALEDTANDK